MPKLVCQTPLSLDPPLASNGISLIIRCKADAMLGDVRDPFGVHSGVRSGSVWANFGSNFRSQELEISEFSICAAVAAAAGAL